jgi:uncharacterized damage-inducible protein DinB
MIDCLQPLAMQFALNTKGIANCFEHITNKAMLLNTGEGANPPLWLLVHLTESRAFFARMVGTKFKPSWGNFSVGRNDLNDIDSYPEIETIEENWNELAGIFEERLKEITEEEIRKPVSRPFPISDGTKLGTLTFSAAHESYHVGQFFGWWRTLDVPGVMNLLYQR